MGSAAQDIMALSLVPGAGRQVVHDALQLAARLGVPLSRLFGSPCESLLRRAAPGEESAAAALHACGTEEQAEAHALTELCRFREIRCWTCLDAQYPKFIRDALGKQAPPVLFYQGNEALIDVPGAAVVGTRQPTQEGRVWAEQAAHFFAEEGITVVSGGATGIDRAAHEATVQAEGTTVVVLPEGIGNSDLAPALQRGLERGQVLSVSEFLPRDTWQTHRAMLRNRTIAACARLGCVIEPRLDGGSMFTAERILERGRPVFYWGGVCRDGALRGRYRCRPLGPGGRLDRARLRAALFDPGAPAPIQGDLFEG